jgi:hypothetical protein
MIHTRWSSDLSAKYSQGSVASCLNGHSFIWEAFPLKKVFLPFLPFRPLAQPPQFLPVFEEDDKDDDDSEA